jgi:hypothetical protein
LKNMLYVQILPAALPAEDYLGLDPHTCLSMKIDGGRYKCKENHFREGALSARNGAAVRSAKVYMQINPEVWHFSCVVE